MPAWPQQGSAGALWDNFFLSLSLSLSLPQCPVGGIVFGGGDVSRQHLRRHLGAARLTSDLLLRRHAAELEHTQAKAESEQAGLDHAS